MSLHLPPERDLPNPDAMFQRILADQAQPDRDELDQRRRRVWLLPVAAAMVLMLVGVGYLVLVRPSAPSAGDAAPLPPAAPAPSGVSEASQTINPVMSVSPSFVGQGTAILGDLKLSASKGPDTGYVVTANVTGCAMGANPEKVRLDQWTLDGSWALTPIGPELTTIPAGECRQWTVQFETRDRKRPVTYEFTADDGQMASWKFW